jgi:hypothetical protein
LEKIRQQMGLSESKDDKGNTIYKQGNKIISKDEYDKLGQEGL